MTRNNLWNIVMMDRYTPTVFLTLLCLGLHCNHYAFSCSRLSAEDIMLYSFSHANIFHLLINLYALWKFRPRWLTVAVSYFITIAIVPYVCQLTIPTCGLSVLLFACYARYYVSWKKSVVRVIVSNTILLGMNMLFANTFFNVMAHAVAFFIAYIIWSIYYKTKQLWKKEN